MEKEVAFAQHQTGRNSGVIDSGIYYQPGSLKAQMAQAGNQSLRAFCYEYGVPFEVCGKLIVATRPDDIPRLDALLQRAVENGVPAMRLHPEEVKEVDRMFPASPPFVFPPPALSTTGRYATRWCTKYSNREEN